MSLRKLVSRSVAGPLLRAYRRRLERGSPPRIPFALWRRLPTGAKQWLAYSVLRPALEQVVGGLRDHPILRSFCDSEDNPWALSPTTLLFLWTLLHEERPKRILEFGSGVSTRLFARYANEMARAGIAVEIVSVEHQEEYLRRVQAALDHQQLGHYVRFIHAPISEYAILGKQVKAYTPSPGSLECGSEDGGFDLCLIDGPPHFIGRLGCLPLASAHLMENAIIVLDDAYRAEEQTVIREWIRAYPEQLHAPRLLLSDDHGMFLSHWRRSPREKTQGQASRGVS